MNCLRPTTGACLTPSVTDFPVIMGEDGAWDFRQGTGTQYDAIPDERVSFRTESLETQLAVVESSARFAAFREEILRYTLLGGHEESDCPLRAALP